MGGFFIRGRFLLICMLGQMGIFQGMHNSGETAAAINSARSVAGRIPQARNPGSSLPSVSRGEKRKPDIDVNMLINDLRRCPPKGMSIFYTALVIRNGHFFIHDIALDPKKKIFTHFFHSSFSALAPKNCIKRKRKNPQKTKNRTNGSKGARRRTDDHSRFFATRVQSNERSISLSYKLSQKVTGAEGTLLLRFFTDTDDEKAVRMYLGEIGLTMDARQAQGIHNPDMNIIQDLTRSLFRKRAHELSGAAFIESEDVSDIRKKEEQLLKSIARNLASLTPSKDKQVDDRRQNENELMMELLINLHKLQIIPNDRLTHFLNEENKGQVILSYAINRFSQHRQPEPPLALLIKDLRAFLGRSPQRKEMRKILNRQSKICTPFDPNC
jgi:hypothetical protein